MSNDGGIQYWQQHGQWQQEQEQDRRGGSVSYSPTSQGDIMDISQLSGSGRYLKQGDVEEPIVVTLQKLELVNVARPNEEERVRPVFHFEESVKPMVFNKTNLNRCAKIFSSKDTDDWIGKRLTIYVDDEVEMAGEIVGGLRVKPAPKAAAKPAAKRTGGIPDMDDDIPF